MKIKSYPAQSAAVTEPKLSSASFSGTRCLKFGIIFLTLFYFTLSSSYSQTRFEKTYGSASRSEFGRDATVLSNGGGYAVTGYVQKSQTNKDIYFLKLDTCGRTNLSRTYGGSLDEAGYSVSELNGGNMAIAGETSTYGSGLSDAYLLKMSGATFTTLAGRAVGDTSIDIGQDFKQISSGYVVTGYTLNSTNGYDVLLTKFNSSLVPQWTYKLGGNHDDQGYAVQQTANGDFIIAGGTKSYGVGNYDVYLIRTNANGIVLWAKAYGNSSLDIGYNVKETLDGGFIVVGKTHNSSGVSMDDVLLLKTTSTGALQWSKSYGGLNDETGEDVVQLSDTSYVVTGYTKSFGSGNWDVYTFKVNASGNTIWARTSGGSGEDKSYSIKKTGDNGFLIAGHTNSFGAGLFDAYILKTNSLGSTGCNDSSGINTYAPHDSTINGFTQDTLLKVINGSAVDTFITVDSVQCSTCNPPLKGELNKNTIPNKLNVYPNPATNYINVDLPFGLDSGCLLEVYDAMGMLVYRQKMNAVESSGKFQINTDTWRQGLYFISVISTGSRSTKTVVITK